jgi:hypothetical protein
MSYSQTWLENPASIRVVLVVATAYNLTTSQEVSFYFSNGGYRTTDGYEFDPVISKDVGLQESLSLDGSTSMSFGDIELYNNNGEYDDLLNTTKYLWTNKSIKIYFGDPGWQTTLVGIDTTFLKIFDGIIDDIDSRDVAVINLKIRDKLEKLNAPISENKIDTYGTWGNNGGQQNKDQLRPIVFGECFNVAPILIDPAQLEYCFSCSNPTQDTLPGFSNNGASEKLTEIRDNGVPIYIEGNATYAGATVNLNNSTFKLLKTPAGAITCTIQGVKKSMDSAGLIQNTYSNTIPSVIGTIVRTFGKAPSRFAETEIDLPTFNNFNQTAEVGVFINQTENLLDVCREIAASVGGQIIMSRTGKLRLIQYGVPLPITVAPSIDITPDDILFDSLSVSNRLPVVGVVKLGYGKNYTVQPGLLSAIPEAHKENFAKEWYTVTVKDEAVLTAHNLEEDVPQKDVALISEFDVTTEATRLLNYYKTQKIVYRFTGVAKLLNIVLGQRVVLYHHRFGLSTGKVGQVVYVAPNWSKDQVDIEVIV